MNVEGSEAEYIHSNSPIQLLATELVKSLRDTATQKLASAESKTKECRRATRDVTIVVDSLQEKVKDTGRVLDESLEAARFVEQAFALVDAVEHVLDKAEEKMDKVEGKVNKAQERMEKHFRQNKKQQTSSELAAGWLMNVLRKPDRWESARSEKVEEEDGLDEVEGTSLVEVYRNALLSARATTTKD